jgi:tetratricopeptide (TPR) repeat protein
LESSSEVKRRIPRLFFVTLLAALLSFAPNMRRAARAARGEDGDAWLSVRSQNFLVVGQARERELRRVAARLEEYRAAFSRLLSAEHFDSSVPTTVVVFRDARAYQPFKPLHDGRPESSVAGYFQPGAEVNYITLALDSETAGGPSTLLHEYTHLLVNNYFSAAPLWLREGLAEFYSTTRVSADRRRLTTGAPLPARVRELRARPLIHLRALFDVDRQSPYYHEPEKRALFYAESWALVHYLLEGRGGERRALLARFVELLASGETADAAFREAFRAGPEELESELSAYVRQSAYGESTETLEETLDFDTRLQTKPLERAAVLACLGDLLLRTDRADEAEPYLTESVNLDPALERARVSLGVLRLRQNRFAEARAELERAVAADAQDYLAHFYLADALRREGAGTDAAKISVADYEARTEAVRSELRKSIEIAPGFVEAYRLLAAVEIERGERPEEAEPVIARAMQLAPRRKDLVLLLAEAKLSEGEFEEARRLAEPLSQKADAHLREQAKELLAHVDAREGAAARAKARDEEAAAEPEASAPVQPCDMPAYGGPQRKPLRFAGEQVCGRLTEIACDADSVVLRVESGARTLNLRAPDLGDIRFVTYTTAVKTGRLACGVRDPANLVLVTFRPKRDGAQDSDGEAVAVEFIPEDWSH